MPLSQSFNETDDIYEPVESDLPPPIPARPQPATNKQKIGGNPNGRVALRPMKQPKPKSTPIKPSKVNIQITDNLINVADMNDAAEK